MDSPLVPNRDCGPCNVCCKHTAILDPTLSKPPGVLCPKWKAGVGCSIYEKRPGVCQSYFCAWRILSQFDDSWRPDLSNIYIDLKGDPPERYRHVLPDAPFSFKFTLLGEVSPQRMELLLITVAALIEYDVPVILAVAAPPEHLGGQALLNPALKPLAATAGKEFREAFAAVLRSCSDVQPVRAKIA